jgi:hypothetical protein
MADPTLNDFLDLVRPELDRRAQFLRKAVAQIESEQAGRGISGNLVAHILDRSDEEFEAGAKDAFRALRRISDATKLDAGSLLQLTVQSLENFVLAIKAASDPEKLKRIVAPAAIDERLRAIDQRLILMVRQYDAGLLDLGQEVATSAFSDGFNRGFGTSPSARTNEPAPGASAKAVAAGKADPSPAPSLGQSDPSQWDNRSSWDAAAQIATSQGGLSEAVRSTTGIIEPPLPLMNNNVFISSPQERPTEPSSVMRAGVTDSPIAGAESTVRPEIITITPTTYPVDPTGGRLVVHSHITINVRSPEFRASDAKLDELIAELRRSNEIAGETRDQLVAEISAGRTILKAPEPDQKLIELLLLKPLRYLADKAGSAVIGGLAVEALHLLLRLL